MANGNFAGGDGSKENPFLIEDAFDLDNVRNGVDKNYKLIKDIDLNIAPFNEGQGWIPIGYTNSSCGSFRGNMDGQGHKLSNLFIYNTKSNCNPLGLFRSGVRGTVKNLVIDNAKVTNAYDCKHNPFRTGILFGAVQEYGSIENVHILNSSVSAYGSVGALCGEGFDYTFKNCLIECIVKSYSPKGTINVHIGGIIGDCYFGANYSNCIFAGKVFSNDTFNCITGRIDKEYMTQRKYLLKNCYWNINTNTSDNLSFGIGKTTEELKTPSTYIDWDKEKLEDGSPVWILKDGEYPKLWFEKLPYKYLLKQNNQYYSIKSQLYDGKMYKPCAKDYKVNGFEDLNDLIKETSSITIEGNKGTENEINIFEFNINNNTNGIEVV